MAACAKAAGISPSIGRARLPIDWRETFSEEIDTVSGTGFGTPLFDMLPYVTVGRNFSPNGLQLTIVMDCEKVFA